MTVALLMEQGLSALRRGDSANALRAFGEVVSLQPAHVGALAAIAAVLTSVGRYFEAWQHCEKVLSLDAAHCDTLINGTLVLSHLGRYPQALNLIERALALRPGDPSALNNYALVLRHLGRNDEALAALQRAIGLSPNDVGSLADLGSLYAALGRYRDSLECLDKVLTLAGNRVEVLSDRSFVLNALNRYDQGIASADRALVLQPGFVPALMNRALALRHLGRYSEALTAVDQVLKAVPTHGPANQAKGTLLAHLNRYGEAIDCFLRVLAGNPGDGAALAGAGIACYHSNRIDEGLALLDKALAVHPADHTARLIRAFSLLAKGDLPPGFTEHEVRWKTLSFERLASSMEAPRWSRNTDPRGKTVLLIHEQGLGDSIQFVRFASLLSDQGAKVILRVPETLKALLATAPGVTDVLAEDDPLPDHDLYSSLLSLPSEFETSLETIPHDIPYLRADRDQVSKWSQRLSGMRKLRVGLVWSGRQYPPMNALRDMPLRFLRPLIELDIHCISLQTDIPNGDMGELASHQSIARWGEELRDFSDTAALIENLDLVISVDTAAVHVAGALGKPVWVMNRFAPCWRWLRNRSDSPWYPTARLYCQDSPGDWGSVVNEVVRDLRTMAPRHNFHRSG